MTKLILASGSRYKRQLFAQLGLQFSSQDPMVLECFSEELSAAQQAKRLSLQKAEALADLNPECLIVGADQVLACEGVLLQKPGTIERAVAQLKTLVGKTHYLHTSVSLICRQTGFLQTENVVSKMMMGAHFEEAYLRKTVEQDKTWDCVGSYKIESLGITLFDKVETPDFTAIVGLPLMTLSRILREGGFFNAKLFL